MCSYDEVHGAFVFARGESEWSIGLVPEDAAVLALVFQNDQVSVASSDDNRVIVRGGPDVVVLPSVDATAQPREAVLGETRPCWECDGRELADAVDAVSVVAKAKDASAVMISCKSDAVTLSARSTSGKSIRAVRARVRQTHAPVGCNLSLLQDVTTRFSKSERVVVALETSDRPSSRAVFTADGCHFVMLTSSE